MAERNIKTTNDEVSEDIQNTQPEKLNLDTKVTVRSITGWKVSFPRRVEGVGDINIPPNGSVRLPRNEIIGQIQRGVKLFTGVDGRGNHATLYIDDKPTRVEVDFESADGKRKQIIFSDKKIKELFAIQNFESFKESFTDYIRTRDEKYAAIEAIKRLNLNDYQKIRFVEGYTGYKIG